MGLKFDEKSMTVILDIGKHNFTEVSENENTKYSLKTCFQ